MKGNKNQPARNHKYDDMLYMPHYQSPNHPPMSLLNRAAQFSPFSALTGYEDAIDETARLTDRRRELSDEETDVLNERLAVLEKHLRAGERPRLQICYFLPDERKQGGAYRVIPAVAKQIEPVARLLVLAGGTAIPLDDIYRIDGAIFGGMEET